MELTPSPLAIVVHKLFERLETEYLQSRPTQSKYFDCLLCSKDHFFIILMFLSHAVPDKDLLELYGLFGDQLQTALDIIDRDKIKIFRRASDKREYIEIVEQQNSIYKLLPNINYCMCADFREKVITSGQFYTCHHVLATKLAVLLGKAKTEITNEEAFSFSLHMIRPVSIAIDPNRTVNPADIE